MTDAPHTDDDTGIGEAPYRDMVQSLSDVILVLDRETGIVRYASPSVATVFGDRPDDLVGVDPFARIHPEDRARQWRRFLQIRRRSGVPPADVFRFADAAGNWRTVETVGSVIADRPEVIVAMRDVTGREQARRDLAASEERRLALANLAPVGIFELDAQGQFVFVNQRLREIVGLTPDTDLAEQWVNLMHPDDRDQMLADFADALVNPRAFEGQVRIVRPDGAERQVLCRADPVYDDDGRLITWIGTAEDVTELHDALVAAAHQAELLEAANRELRASQAAAGQANRAKSEFLSRMSHELRTPLNSIIGFAQLLEEGDLDPEGRDEAVRLIRSSGRHLLSLVEEVLDISRIETGGMSLSLEPVDLGHLVDDALRVLGPEAAAHEVSLLVEGGSGTTYVRADRQRLLQVLLNLLSNAIKYNRPDGWVSVGHTVDDTVVHLSVSDSGRGIAREHLARLFEPFERLDAETIGVTGTGLGLTVSRALLEQMGGTLEVVSTVGQGTAFTVTLPLAAGEDRSPTAELPITVPDPPPGGEPGAGGPLTVLYIEDNPVNFRLVERCLQARPNVRVLGAGDGRSGLEAVRREHPDLVLLDLHLPDLSGFEVLMQLRSDPETAELPVTVLTADATPGLREQVTRDARTGYLTKPLQLADLLDLVDGVRVQS